MHPPTATEVRRVAAQLASAAREVWRQQPHDPMGPEGVSLFRRLIGAEGASNRDVSECLSLAIGCNIEEQSGKDPARLLECFARYTAASETRPTRYDQGTTTVAFLVRQSPASSPDAPGAGGRGAHDA